MSRHVKITIAEPSEIIRGGVIALLKKMHSLHPEIFEVDGAEQLKNSVGWQRPDLLLVNPACVGAMPLQQLRKDADNPSMKCVALQTSLVDAASLRNYDEVLSIYEGGDQIREKLIRLISAPETGKRTESLSEREKEVVVAVVKGLTNKQIADEMCLSTHTVITHRRNISAKLDIHSTAGLTIYAIVNRLVELDDINRQ